MKYAIGKPFVADGSSLGGDFLIPSTVSTFSGESGQVQANWGLDNCRDEHIQRSVRINSGADRTITFNTTSQEPDAIFVEGLNVSQIRITTGAKTGGTLLTCEMNPRTGRYQVYHEPALGASTTYTIVMLNSARVVASDTYLECGRISMVKSGSLKTMPAAACWGQPFQVAVDSLGGERTMSGGEVQSAGTSLSFVRIDLQGLFKLSDSSQTQHPYAFCRMKRDERVLLFENRSSDTNKVYCHLLRRMGEASISEEFPTLDVSVPMQEVI